MSFLVCMNVKISLILKFFRTNTKIDNSYIIYLVKWICNGCLKRVIITFYSVIFSVSTKLLSHLLLLFVTMFFIDDFSGKGRSTNCKSTERVSTANLCSYMNCDRVRGIQFVFKSHCGTVNTIHRSRMSLLLTFVKSRFTNIFLCVWSAWDYIPNM